MEETRSLRNLILSIAGSIIVLTLVGWIVFDWWFELFSIAISWVIADVILSAFVRGGGGIFQIPHVSGTVTVTKGRAYLAFLVSIFAVTLISSGATQVLYEMTGIAIRTVAATGVTLLPIQVAWTTLLVCNILVGCLVFLDMKARFYARNKN